MEQLDATLQILFPEADRATVRQRVANREVLAAQHPAVQQWIDDMQRRMRELLSAEFLTKNYGDARMAVLVLLAREGIVAFTSPYDVSVLEQEAKPTRYLREQPRNAFAVEAVVPAPVSGIAEPERDDPSSHVLGEHMPVTSEATPPYVEDIRGMLVERNDSTWLVECNLPCGAILQVSALGPDGQESSFEVPIERFGAQSVHLKLPAHVRPTTVVFVALDADGIVVGKGLFGEKIE